jgi:hypothetical protein
MRSAASATPPTPAGHDLDLSQGLVTIRPQVRPNSVATRDNRLAAVRSQFSYLAPHPGRAAIPDSHLSPPRASDPGLRRKLVYQDYLTDQHVAYTIHPSLSDLSYKVVRKTDGAPREAT